MQKARLKHLKNDNIPTRKQHNQPKFILCGIIYVWIVGMKKGDHTSSYSNWFPKFPAILRNRPVWIICCCRNILVTKAIFLNHIWYLSTNAPATPLLLRYMQAHSWPSPGVSCLRDYYLTHPPPLIKWPPFCRRYFQMHFPEWKILYFDSNFT